MAGLMAVNSLPAGMVLCLGHNGHIELEEECANAPLSSSETCPTGTSCVDFALPGGAARHLLVQATPPIPPPTVMFSTTVFETINDPVSAVINPQIREWQTPVFLQTTLLLN